MELLRGMAVSLNIFVKHDIDKWKILLLHFLKFLHAFHKAI